MTVDTLEAAKECIDEMKGQGTVFSYKHSYTGKFLYAVFSFTQFIDIFDAPFCSEVKLLYNGTTWVI